MRIPEKIAHEMWQELSGDSMSDGILGTSFRFTEEGDWGGVWCEVTINPDRTVNLHLNNLDLDRAKKIIAEFGR
jgi:hypothetical protein